MQYVFLKGNNFIYSLGVAFLFLMLTCSNSSGDEIYLKNGDKITGEILSEENNKIVLKTEAIGIVNINRENVESIIADGKKIEKAGIKEKEEEIVWKREISLGYNASRGNTETGEFSGDFLVNRNHKHVNEVTFKGNMFYSEANNAMDAQRWYGLGRYAFSFTENKKWYNFYRVEVDHDRFANINYRALPATGLGYWFFDSDDIKLMAEIGAGWEHTDYSDDAKDGEEAVLVPRAYFEKRFFDNIVISEDLYLYPSLRDFGDYRFQSETSVTSKINSQLAIRLSLIDEYNAQPKDKETKKNDLRLMTSLIYSF